MEFFFEKVNWFDLIFLILLIYFVFQCSMKGFSLSFLSFLKWIVALILTLIFLPKLQPWVSEYIDSPFINSVGLRYCLIRIFFIFTHTFE